jgi:PAS domain S-box-containing protein
MSLLLRLALLLVVLLAAALVLLLAAASSSSSAFDRFYPWLVGVNALVALLMAGLTAGVVLRAWRRYRQKVFGARIMIRLAFAFALIGVVPVAMVSLVSAQFLARTIDSWFSQGVNVALESGVSLGRAALDGLSSDTLGRARRLALAIEDLPSGQMIADIEKAVEGRDAVEVLVLSGSGTLLASRSAQLTALLPRIPSPEDLNRARVSRQIVIVEPEPGSEGRRLQIRAIAMGSRVTPLGDETRFVQWIEQIPPALSNNLEILNDGVRDYQQLILGKQGLRKIYGVTLLLALMLACFAALLSAVLLSGWLAGPLRQLERATKAVASGDYRPLRVAPASNDELNLLVASFNDMTSQLQEARDIAQRSRLRLEESNLFLQQILANLSAGVIVLDAQWRLIDFNSSAERMLGVALQRDQSQSLDSLPLLGSCHGLVQGSLERQAEVQFQHESLKADGRSVTLLVSGSRLPGKQPRYVLIFDDIGELLSAQRARDFADMARRLAHEIKNPLTPIQLSAERLERRLLERLNPEDAELLGRSIRTIVEQVTALKAMVDEFRNYARLPAPNPETIDLGDLLGQMQMLYATDRRITWPASPPVCRILADRAQIIQVIHNLIQNAQDAVADRTDGMIRIGLDLVASGDEASLPMPPGRREGFGGHRVRLSIIDNGPGISPEVRSRLFEPYFTSKVKGSGLGLAIVKKIVEENLGRVAVLNRSDVSPGGGSGAMAVVEFAKLEDATENDGLMPLKLSAHG